MTKATSNSLLGLVLCGGQSTRMGVDKSRLVYHGVEQRFYLYNLLSKICERTIISTNEIQPGEIEFLPDDKIYKGNGPISGLLTAFRHFPGRNIFLVGCDYPFLDETEINNFINSIPSNASAAAFFNTQHNLYEPVLAWYSQQAHATLQDQFARGNTSLQSFLQSVDAFKYIPSNSDSLRSVDTHEEFLRAASQLKAKS